MGVQLSELHSISKSAIHVVYVDLSKFLTGSEVLTGTPVVAEIDSANLTIDNEALVTTATTLPSGAIYYGGDSDAIAANTGVRFTVTGTTEALHTVRVTVGTDATPAQSIVVDLDLFIVD